MTEAERKQRIEEELAYHRKELEEKTKMLDEGLIGEEELAYDKAHIEVYETELAAIAANGG